MNHWTQLHELIKKRLINSSLKMSLSSNKKYLQDGKCPHCGENELFASCEMPPLTTLKCGNDDCAKVISVQEIIPDLFNNLSDHVAEFEVASAYLETVCGFDLQQIGKCWEQESYYHTNAKPNGSVTIRFYLNAERTEFYEHLIKPLMIDIDGAKQRKTENIKGKTSWWNHPAHPIEDNKTVVITERVIDALSFIQNGQNAVAILNAKYLPDTIEQYTGKGITWLFAFNNDVDGKKYLQRHAKKLEKLNEQFSALTVNENEPVDWNRLHKQKKLTVDKLKNYRSAGDLLLAKTKEEKAFAVFLQHNEKARHFVFDYKNKTYSVEIDLEKYNDSRDAVDANQATFDRFSAINLIAHFRMEYLYHQKPENGTDGHYVLRFHFANGAPYQDLNVPPSAFSSKSKFKDSALRVTGGSYKGDSRDIDYLYTKWTDNWSKSVKTLSYIGYDNGTKAYIYNNVAIIEGMVIQLNREGYFKLPNGIGIKTQIDNAHIITDKQPSDFYSDYELAYGENGIIMLANALGSLFAQQIRKAHSSYPLTEIIGEPDSGKTHMIQFIYKLLGVDYHTMVFNPTISSMSGRYQRLSSISNLPITFNETESDSLKKKHNESWDWEKFLDLFDGILGRGMGGMTGLKSTATPLFLGVLWAVQNIAIDGSTALRSRFVHIQHDKTNHSPEGYQADKKLMAMTNEQLSGWLINTLTQEQAILETFFKNYDSNRQKLTANIKESRVIHNHAQLMSLVDCLPLVCPISSNNINAVKHKIIMMAKQRQANLHEDHPLLVEFWSAFEYLNNSMNNELNWYEEDDLIYINLNHFENIAKSRNQNIPDLKILRKLLESSKNPEFVKKNFPVHVNFDAKKVKGTHKVWVFKKNKKGK